MTEKTRYELKKIAEDKAMTVAAGNHTRAAILEKKAYYLCWTGDPSEDGSKFDQAEYDAYYTYYDTCLEILMAGGKLKSERLDGEMTVVRTGGTIVGCMSWETPIMVLADMEGREYKWVSETIEHIGLHGAVPGTKIQIKAFVRPGNAHLYRVRVA